MNEQTAATSTIAVEKARRGPSEHVPVTQEMRHRDRKLPRGSTGEAVGGPALGVGCPGVAGLLAGQASLSGYVCDPRLAQTAGKGL